MKDYLNQVERENFTYFLHSLNGARLMLDRTSTYTKEELTNLKKCITWGKKVEFSVAARLNESANTSLDRTVKKSKIYLEDRHIADMYEKRK